LIAFVAPRGRRVSRRTPIVRSIDAQEWETLSTAQNNFALLVFATDDQRLPVARASSVSITPLLSVSRMWLISARVIGCS